jgi:hypothetical protein
MPHESLPSSQLAVSTTNGLTEESSIEEYITVAAAAAHRGRSILIVMITASILAFSAFWNSRQGSWLNSRLRLATEGAQWMNMKQDDRDRLTQEQRDYYRRSEEYMAVRGIQTPDQINEVVKRLQALQSEQVNLIKIPFFGSIFDVNDLGLLGGFAFAILLLWFKFGMSRELQNIILTFNEGRRRKQLRVCYQQLAMQQVLTVPKMLPDHPHPKQISPSFWDKLPKILFVLPFLVHATVFGYDLYSFKFGMSVSQFNTIFNTAFALLFLAIILMLTVSCYLVSYEISNEWKQAYDELTPKNDAKRNG